MSKTPIANAPKSRCPKCGSTARCGYFNVRSISASGLDPDGHAYNQVTWRRTRCSVCGQSRDDKSFEMVAKDGKPKSTSANLADKDTAKSAANSKKPASPKRPGSTKSTK